jgi:hypothetical protein
MFTTQTCISAGPASLSECPLDSVVSPDASIDQNVQNFISSVEDTVEIEDGNGTEEIDEAENVVFDGDRPVNRTYYIGCQAVYTNSFNAKGVEVKDSGNHIPQVSYRGGTVVVRSTSSNEGASLSNSSAALARSSRSRDSLLDSTLGSSPLPFQLSSSTQSWRPSDPAIEIPMPSRRNNPFLNQLMDVPPVDIPLPSLEEGHVSMSSRKRGKLPATIETNLKLSPTNAATSHFTSNMPATSTLPGSESQNSKLLEYHLESALATALTIQTSGVSKSTDILSPRARNTLKALHALVSMEMPVSGPKTIASASDPPAPFNNVTKNLIKWLGFSQSPKKQHTLR